jgi:hemoglobin
LDFFFTEIIPVDFPAHLPKMYAFWESILFGTPGYKGEPMTAHVHIHEKHKMEHAHFEQWLLLFRTTVDELFSGPKADEIKQRAASIATIMEWKVTGKEM